LLRLSRDIWDFYEHYVTEEDQYLPPDNVQFEPDNGIAHRTSPTNIGLYLSCAVAARDFGFIDTPGMVERLERTVATLERMDKWEGHLYNWYDTQTLAALQPVYVSTVDSGNLVACLIAAREGLAEWLQAPDQGAGLGQAFDRSQRKKDRYEAAFSSEISGGLRQETGLEGNSRNVSGRTTGKHRVLGSDNEQQEWKAAGHRLVERMDALVAATDFRPLYDHKAKLFALGYQVTQQQRETVLYDLMASEARQASYVAIALGQISVSHWNALGRTLVKPDKRPALLSWSGTMFEYLMPWLFMRTYRHTLWDTTYRAVVDRQIAYAKQRGVPFGISESGFYAFDYRMNYQYRAFGVPGLGFKRGLEEDLVLAPYATIMALPFAGRQSLEALQEMERLGGRGKYGYYEAMDFTRKRMPEGKRHMVIRSFMAHHQGMSLLTLSNLLLPRTMVDRFHDNKQMQAAELLLQERNPANPKWLKHPALRRVHNPDGGLAQERDESRSWAGANTRLPEVCVLSNGRLTSVLTNSGSGFTRFEGVSVSRWREDPIKDAWGSYMYVRDIGSGHVWSPSYQPCRTESEEQNIEFHLDHAAFSRVEAGIATRMDVCVSPERNAEVRRMTLTNRGAEERVIEVTTFVELALADSIADDAHTAFSKLFIRTQYDQDTGCLVAGRRPREAKDRTLWAAHQLYVDSATLGPPEFETDRAAFIGRGNTLAEPRGISTRLHGQTGSVADPAFVMRRRVRLEPGDTVQLFAVTSVGATREEAVETAAYFAGAQTVERTFQLAWNRSRIELRHLQLSQREANSCQQLAGQVLYTPPLREERARSIAANGQGQSSLWAFGISGDRPIALVQIADRSHLPFILALLTGHEYIRRLGISFDLVILNESAGGYQQQLQESLQRAVEHGVDRFGTGAAGIHVIAANQLPEESLALLSAVARVRLKAGGASLAAQLRLPKTMQSQSLPQPLAPSGSGRAEAMQIGAVPEHLKDLLFYNGWGGFTADGQEYKLAIRGNHHLPAPWINVLANKRFGAIVSELGRGYTWWRNSRECKLTPWSNDPVLDPPGEIGFIRDEESGASWGLSPSSGQTDADYEVTHGFGYSRFVHESYGIRHQMSLFVPLEEPVKIMQIKLANHTGEQRSISVTYYAEWVLGVTRQANASYIVTEWNESAELMTARNRYQETFREATAFLGIYADQSDGEASADSSGLSWTADQEEFIGRGGSAEQPAALGRERLSGRTGASYASCGAVQRKLTLAPGEERMIVILLGCGESEQEAAALAQRYREPDACDQALAEVRAFWERTLRQTVVTTPSAEMNVMLGGWLLYQSLACRMWARTAFYQAGGAYGYRDQLQDSLALLHTMPEATRAQILIHAAHQYEEGDVQHWWHVETERGIRTLFSDDLLWLPYTVSRYIEQTGDLTILEEQAYYITSEPLREGEHERYEETVRSTVRASVYDHCLRAIDRALSRMGEHGLPLIGVGDWNDGMNLVGDEGRGESVWLGWFICEVLRRFDELCTQQGDSDRAEHYRRTRERLAAATNEHGWDGQWYRRAFTDAGTWLGSIHNGECRIDAIAQSWSVISGAAPKDRALQAMQAFDRELVDRELSVVRLLTPPFDETEPSPGYIQGYPPGIRENGAQYTHGVLWGIMAWSQLGQGDKAFELFHMLNPINHTRTEQEVKRYVGEPYVMAADVYTAEPHPGHAGWTWYTGASSWMYQVGLEWILGIRRQGSRLYVDPCIPASWPGFTADYRFGETTYAIKVSRQPQTESSAIVVRLDGSELAKEPEGAESRGAGIPLLDDGKPHAVEVILPAR
jgi:cyclic beta-1,2-glucan synthetase